jgi:two-component system sensor histidine kinase AtoS
VDAELLRAAVVNLLLNAIQAMTGGGRIDVVIRQNDMAVVEVRDTGPGIPHEIRDRVFEPFFTTKTRGGGLGLPIAQRTADLQGGSLALDVPEDGGTRVRLKLPIHQAGRTRSPAVLDQQRLDDPNRRHVIDRECRL